MDFIVGFNYSVEDALGNLDASDPIEVRTSATTDASGLFTVDITNASLTRVAGVNATVVDASSGVSSTTLVSFTTVNSTTVSGVVHIFTQTLGVLNMTTAAGVLVHLVIEGDQS